MKGIDEQKAEANRKESNAHISARRMRCGSRILSPRLPVQDLDDLVGYQGSVAYPWYFLNCSPLAFSSHTALVRTPIRPMRAIQVSQSELIGNGI
jgi:hypothetical protein